MFPSLLTWTYCFISFPLSRLGTGGVIKSKQPAKPLTLYGYEASPFVKVSTVSATLTLNDECFFVEEALITVCATQFGHNVACICEFPSLRSGISSCVHQHLPSFLCPMKLVCEQLRFLQPTAAPCPLRSGISSLLCSPASSLLAVPNRSSSVSSYALCTPLQHLSEVEFSVCCVHHHLPSFLCPIAARP